jgi:proteasome-associated ATPase
VAAALDEDELPRKLRPGDSLLVDTKAGYAFERIPQAEVEDLVLEEVPVVAYSDIGGLTRQIEQIRDAVELRFLHKELYREYSLLVMLKIKFLGRLSLRLEQVAWPH